MIELQYDYWNFYFLAVKVTMEDKFSDIMLTKYRKNVDGTLERLDEYSFSVYFNWGEGKRIFV